jgi:Uma2 family endonuclease
MPVALGETIYTPPAPQYPPRKLWSREEYEAFERTGLWEGQHYELIEGELINKMGKNKPHVIGNQRVHHILNEIFGWQRVFSESPIDVAPEDRPTSEPEPDFYVLRSPGFRGDRPAPDELALIVEISDTTLTWDTTTKAALYARAGIADYWVLDLNGHRLIVHRDPSGNIYKSVIAYNEQERVAPLAAPRGEVLVADLLTR